MCYTLPITYYIAVLYSSQFTTYTIYSVKRPVMSCVFQVFHMILPLLTGNSIHIRGMIMANFAWYYHGYYKTAWICVILSSDITEKKHIWPKICYLKGLLVQITWNRFETRNRYEKVSLDRFETRNRYEKVSLATLQRVPQCKHNCSWQ